MKTWTAAIWPVLQPNIRHFNITGVAQMMYLSSDRIMTRSVRRLCSAGRSFTSHFQMCDMTNICCVAIENPQLCLQIQTNFIAI
jgi:hypothetical protein